LIRCRRFRADVYHAHDLEALIPAWIASKLLSRQVIYDSHELFTERPIEFPGIWRRIERFLLKRVDEVIAASPERAEIMHREYGSPRLPSVLINCPPKEFRHSRSSLRDVLPGDMRSKNLILYQGGLSPNRCLEDLTLAAKYFDDDNVLVFLGNSNDFSRSVLCGLIKANALEEKVIFIPGVDSNELTSFISSADLGVVIYRNNCRNNYYCAPNKLFDYCMAGLPMIGCDFPPLRSFQEQYGIIRLFDPENPTSIAKTVNEYLRDKPAYAQAKRRIQDVASKYNWENECTKLINIYDAIGL
jgi:glycosyltransferase involved in cell wall biosynthesis